MDTVIIGGGAAGVAAAIAAAERGQRVTVLERNTKPLKKLGVTGNGRANLLNAGLPVYYGEPAFARAVLAAMPYDALVGFFTRLGVPLRAEGEGRIYPAALLASVVTDALLLRARQLGVVFRTGIRVDSLRRDGQGFQMLARILPQDAPAQGKRSPRGAVAAPRMQSEGIEPAFAPHAPGMPADPAQGAPNPGQALSLKADRVIVTVGGAAAPVHGTDGTAYGLLTAFGHRLTPLTPALCALQTQPRLIAGLSGQRVRACLTLLSAAGAPLHTAAGEVLFGDDAVSGIAAMQLARFFAPGATLLLDLREAAGWLPPVAAEPAASGGVAPLSPPTPIVCCAPVGDVAQRIRALVAMRHGCTLAELFTGVFTTPISRALCRMAGLLEPALPLARLRPEEEVRLATAVCAGRLPVTGTRGFDYAQVTAGGIATDGFTPATMESVLCKGLHAAGEVLNVDGDCGGFNLMFAFAGGLLAGRAGET